MSSSIKRNEIIKAALWWTVNKDAALTPENEPSTIMQFICLNSAIGDSSYVELSDKAPLKHFVGNVHTLTFAHGACFTFFY